MLRIGLADGAYYLAGYAVECAIKACIARGTRRFEFPDKQRANSSYTHHLGDLIRVAGLENALKERFSREPQFNLNWKAAAEWSELSRYERHDRESAKELLRAITERGTGVISWLKRYW